MSQASFHDKVVFITGAASGIGAATATLFAESGAQVVLVDRDSAGAQGAASIVRNGGEAIFAQADVTSADDMGRAVAAAVARFGRIDVLVNNAGMTIRHTSIEEWSVEEFRRVVDINLNSQFIATHAALPALKAAYSTEQSRARVLRVELSLAEAELKKRIAACKPPEPPKPVEPPKPPQVAVAPPPPKPAPAPTPPPALRQPQPPPPNDGRLRLPSVPSNDYSFMAGCWRTDPFRHETMQVQAGVSTYCFDSGGNGQLEWRRGRTACRTRVQSRYQGNTLALRDSDTFCNDGSRWYADQLTCRRGADDVAQCSGSSRGAYGPVSWTVNLHKLN